MSFKGQERILGAAMQCADGLWAPLSHMLPIPRTCLLLTVWSLSAADTVDLQVLLVRALLLAASLTDNATQSLSGRYIVLYNPVLHVCGIDADEFQEFTDSTGLNTNIHTAS